MKKNIYKKSSKKQFSDYFLGLDIGTESVGWAVTDTQYDLQKFNSKAMWGVRVFDAGKTAEERRLYRSARRRNDRKVQRLKLLKDIFAEEVAKVDDEFFLRLKQSKYMPEDKGYKDIFFRDKTYSDKAYNQEFPTIYHLRKSLIENKRNHDIRLVYLAISNLIKYRGHFLFEGQDFQTVTSFSVIFEELNQKLYEEFNVRLDCQNIHDAEEVLKQKGINHKKRALFFIFNAEDNRKKAIIELMCGATVQISKLFNENEEDTSDEAKIKISFAGEKYQEQYDDLFSIIQEKIYLLDSIKAVYDWSIFADILKGEPYLSFGKVNEYEMHKSDLKKLKQVILKYFPKEKYDEVFQKSNIKCNYAAYVGISKKNDKKNVVENPKCSQEDFCKYISKLLNSLKEEDEVLKHIKERLEANSFMPKQTSKDNGVIPYQAHLIELETILENVSEYLPWLNQKDQTGWSPKEKIKETFLFRIPYYVGPLNDYHKDKKHSNCWVVKNSSEKIFPWNFKQVVNLEDSAEAFIKRMTKQCTYLFKEDVIPKHSLIYSKFVVLNELNNVTIRGEHISVELKQNIFEHLFKTKKRVTKKSLFDYLLTEGHIDKSITMEDISGIDGDFKNSLVSYIDLKKIFKDQVIDESKIEGIIESIVLFGEDNKILIKRLKRILPEISKDKLKAITKLKYIGWGRLSKEFLCNISVNSKSSEMISFKNIMEAMWESNYNLMQLLSERFDTLDQIQQWNMKDTERDQVQSFEALIEELYVSPAIKRSIWQTISIVEEIKKIMGKQPKKIFIEVAKEDGIKGDQGRRVSRKTRLMELYNNCKLEEKDWIQELTQKLQAKNDDELRRDRLFLYFSQKGRCMYSGETIDINELYSANLYDIDHIYPQSYVKDDSISNRVLVKRTWNAKKGDRYPLPSEIRQNRKAFWRSLYQSGFIDKLKYEKLSRNTEFADEEKAGFIARQLVETRQSTKAIARLLNTFLPDSEIVYVKAGNVTEFRRGVKCFKDQMDEKENEFIKVREINDFHHAQDAYLNIVVGNVFHTKFTRNPINFIKSNDKHKYNMRRMYEFNVERDGQCAWEIGKEGTMATVKKNMKIKKVLFTRYAVEEKGGFFNQMPVKKGKGQMPLKTSDPFLKDISKYGGYNKVSGAYFFLVEHISKKKKIKTMEFIPVHVKKSIQTIEKLYRYAKEILGLQEPRIILKKVKFNTLFEIDGFRMHLSARTGEQLLFKGANALHLDEDSARYIKKIVKFIEKAKILKQRKEEPEVHNFDGIKEEENILLYNLFMDKLSKTLYKVKLKSQFDNLKRGKDKFLQLSLRDQVGVLYEILHLFQANVIASNLELIGGGKSAGKIQSSKNLMTMKGVKIIQQSPTGLFEQVLDIDSL
jgi:CRISPR-associated endonuclease Csn1